MMSQKEAVFKVVTEFYGSKFENGMSHTKEAKSAIVDALIEGFKGGLFKIENEQENLRVYIVGLLNNHLRKDTRLNGGSKYVAAKPGSRAGGSNPTVKALRGILKQPGLDEKTIANINADIAAIQATERAEKLAKAIDVEALPEKYRHLVK